MWAERRFFDVCFRLLRQEFAEVRSQAIIEQIIKNCIFPTVGVGVRTKNNSHTTPVESFAQGQNVL